jgi:hypothetical protein
MVAKGWVNKEFQIRHSMYPVWILLYFGWKLEYGWKECDDPGTSEAELKGAYRKSYGGKLSALVEQ